MQHPSVRHTFATTIESCRRLAGNALGEFARGAYWLAVLIPLAYLLVLPATALHLVDVQALLVMALVHALAVLLGHRHDPR